MTEIIQIIARSGGEDIYKPAVQPQILAGILTLDCQLYKQVMFEPRKNVENLSIDGNFTIVLSNTVNCDLISIVLSLTGIVIIKFPYNVVCSNQSTSGSWNPSTQELILSATTDELIELQLLKYVAGSKFILNVSEKVIS
jgi:hypothetical protein